MSREILFKGKTESGEWVEGSLIELDRDSAYVYICKPYLLASSLSPFELIKFNSKLVLPETICQFTGLHDKHGKRIWENDIVNVSRPMGYNKIGTVLFDTAKFVVRYKGWRDDTILGEKEQVSGMGYSFEHTPEYEVIGNIYDNKLEDFESED